MPSAATPSATSAGVVFPSPVVMLSVVAVAMAGIAYVATQGEEPTEREVTTVSAAGRRRRAPSPGAADADDEAEEAEPAVSAARSTSRSTTTPASPAWPAGSPAPRPQAGWQVVGSDNWYGTIPASTVYFPPRLKAAAPSCWRSTSASAGSRPPIDPMRLDRLTVILTADAA